MEECPHCKRSKPRGNPCPYCRDSKKFSAVDNILKDRQLGPYKVLDLIAEGGMGRIYKALHTTLFKYVAIKVLTIEQAFRDPNILDRFIQEAQLTAKLRHPNIVTVYHAGNEEGIYYIAMDLVEGRTLAEILREKKLTVREGLQIIEHIARALHYAHENKIIHRDVKPENIILDKNNVPFIMDFGLAKDTRINLALTQAGNIVGSPNYMSPEQAQGKKLDHRSDIFSLGAVLYEMLTFQKAFQGRSSLEVIQKVISANHLPIHKIAPYVHKDIETICNKCLEKMPHARYQTALEISDDIQRFLRGEIIRARPARVMYRMGKWMMRNRLVTALFSIALLCIATAMVALIMLYSQSVKARQREKEREVCTGLMTSSRRMVAEIENAWRSTITDARVLARTEELMAIMEMEQHSLSSYEKASVTLRMWAEIKGYLAIFLLNRDGYCVISSDKKFERESYDFRPYYQLARDGRETIYYAIGTTTATPGYYCAVPSFRDGSLIGVCVIKFALEPIFQIINRITIFKSEKIFLAEENGILIQSNYADTPLLVLSSLDRAKMAEIENSRQFLGQSLTPSDLRFSSPPDLRSEQMMRVLDGNNTDQLVIITPLEKFPYALIRLIEYEELSRLCKNLSD